MPPAFDEQCIFCKIARGDFGTEFVAKTERVVAFADIDPKAPVHVLVVPTEHVASLAELTDPSLAGEALMLAAEVSRKRGIDKTGYRVVANTGPDGGQSVDHLHFHVLGGKRLSERMD